MPRTEPSAGPDAAATGTLRARLPPLVMVRAFEAVGRAGSMRQAAADIGVSHTVISRHVRNLEAWLGTRLVDAGPRGVTLTGEGRRFFAATSQALELIARSALELRPQIRRGTLKVWCMPGLATRWLTPRLSQIQQALPGIDIVLRAIPDMPDFSRYEADLMIAFGNAGEMPPGAVPLTEPRMFPVASPKWIEANGMPTSPRDLPAHPLIHEESREQWRHWLELAGARVDRSLRGPRLWDANLCLDAAIAGQGIALATRLNAGDDLAAGRLVELFETEIRVGGYFLVAPPERWNDQLLARYRAWIEAAIAETERG